MKTSAIRHPENNYFIIRRDWQLRALEIEIKGPKRGNSVECAAEMLSVMEFHFNNRYANKKLKEFVERAIASADKKLPPLGDWMPYSYRYIEDLLLNGRSQNVIIQAISILVSKGFVSTAVPEDILEAYGGGITWLKLEVDNINAWIEANTQKSWLEVASPDRNKGGRPKKPEKMTKADTIAKSVEILGNFYRHIHHKNSNFVMDGPRINKVKARLKEPDRTLGMAAQAIIGNLYSEYHQGRHKDNMLGIMGERGMGRVYDDIDNIFGNAKRFESHMGYAEDAGITEKMAFAELEAFLAGQPSRYAKKGVKPPQNEQKQPEKASIEKPKNEKRYREFAFQIAAFFTTNVPSQDILDMCVKDNDQLIAAGKGLTDAAYLAEAIRQSTKVFIPSLTEQMETELAAFTKAFCEKQSLNTVE